MIEVCKKIPFCLREKVRTELQRIEETGVIEKVTKQTEWVLHGYSTQNKWTDQNLLRSKKSE